MRSLGILIIFALSLTSFRVDKSINEFLQEPFDLLEFKKVKGQSNSGGAKGESYYLKPEKNGFYYRFFFFRPMKGYIFFRNGKDSLEIPMENGLEITTYKEKGRHETHYIDPTETLIEVAAQYNDYDLPQLAFIGLDSSIVKTKLGNEFTIINDCMIYQNDGNALILHLKYGADNWLKYVRLNQKILNQKIPIGLLEI